MIKNQELKDEKVQQKYTEKLVWILEERWNTFEDIVIVKAKEVCGNTPLRIREEQVGGMMR